MLQRAASNAYSWWWASHVRTKQSKWLDNNLKDMEDRVKCILFLLGEEADSFAKRAEMYYKRRPEVIDSVEEAYRAYRALAERYDHISGELHKANHTIVTAFPDQVQYALLEEDDDNLPKAFTTVDPRKIHKSTVEGLMKKKHGGKSELKNGGKKSANPISKENAHAEIGRLQKEILVLQTEKEFIKSSYESGIAKYWDLEKQINDMQEEVCYFQEEFNENAVIEDDEARALMTATALKSCEDAIMKFQEQQRTFFSQAITESERVKVAREKLESLMRAHGKSLSYSGNPPYGNVKNDVSIKIYELYSMKKEKIELQETVDKIKEYFQMNSDLSVEEIAEKIDELVNKVVDLEIMVSSQTAQINGLCLENNELEKSLQTLQEEKIELANGPGELTDKLKETEEELIRVENAGRSYHAEERVFYSNFTEIVNSFCDITKMLRLPPIEHQDISRCMLTDKATPSIGTEPSGEHDKTNPPEDPETDEDARNTQVDGSPEHYDIPETDILPNDRENVKQEDSKQYYSTPCNNIFEDNNEENMKMNKEGSSVTRSPTTLSVKVADVEDQEDSMIKLQDMLMNRLQDKEKVLLAEYTSVLRNYKNTKKKLMEEETKNQESLNQMTAMISDLRSTNAMKDVEIRSLRELLNSFPYKNASYKGRRMNSTMSLSEKDGMIRGHRRTPSFLHIHQRAQSTSSMPRIMENSSSLKTNFRNKSEDAKSSHDAVTSPEIIILEDVKLTSVGDMENASPLEEKFRADIDTFMEENLAFLMKFSMSFQQIQGFQTKYEQLQPDISKLINEEKLKATKDHANNHPARTETEATEKRLRELKIELQVWLEQNEMLKGELQCRFDSLCSIQAEIEEAMEMGADTEEGARFAPYQAAKFQGEVSNMKHENNKVANELQAGLVL
ncbi:hypothetical protein PR202_ga11063 [Eleusine coracana subsp. coracana]|uniref:NAB domain-containing protein n=1 Tax=Eleusine coracana subsp. coracana TaxID=191504 RepID=A0AAV5C8D6_ELECO|nr:hypothetical protein PR202_ga11063 [Eleusine coracana subsp. coracana]